MNSNYCIKACRYKIVKAKSRNKICLFSKFAAMIAIGNVLISNQVVDEHFVCDLVKCKGGCCVDGDAGAPLDNKELKELNEEADAEGEESVPSKIPLRRSSCTNLLAHLITVPPLHRSFRSRSGSFFSF